MSAICPVCLEVQPSGALLSHVRAEHIPDIGASWTRPVATGAQRWPENIAQERCGRCDHHIGVHETVGPCSTPRCPCRWPILRRDDGEQASLAS